MSEFELIVYTDYVSPACYLAEATLAELRSDTRISIEHRPFELFPPPAPAPDFSAPAEIETWDREIAPRAERMGLKMRRPELRVRTGKAHEAALFAASQGGFQDMHHALYAAYLEQGRDIGRVDELVEIGVEAGLDRTELKVALDLDTYTAKVREYRRIALASGLSGAPAFVATSGERGRALIGWHDADSLRDWLIGVPGGERAE